MTFKVPLADEIIYDIENLTDVAMQICHQSYEKTIPGSTTVLDIILWDDRVVTVTFGEWPESDPAVINGEGPGRKIKRSKIEYALRDLLNNGVPFKTDSGVDEDTVCLQFDIRGD